MADPDASAGRSELVEFRLNGVLTLTLNRPEVLNAFSREQYRRVSERLDAAREDPGVSVVVLTGTGRAFSAGVDLREHAARTPESSDRAAFERFVDAMSTFPKPLLCAVNGLAVGVGATMLGLADLVVMSEDAQVQLPFAARSIAPEAASTFTLPSLLGPQQAAWAMLSGSWVSAAECLAAGWAFRVCPAEQLLAEATSCAETIAAHPVENLLEIKALLTAARVPSIAAARAREARAHGRWSARGGARGADRTTPPAGESQDSPAN